MNTLIMLKRLTSLFILCTFLLTTILPVTGVSAQNISRALNLPIAGSMVSLTPAFHPAIIKGIKVFPNDPLRFDFIIDTGDSQLENDALAQESIKLIKYFLAALTVPEENLWVNLSPYEKDRIIADDFSKTEMGRDMLAQDYLLKQITASLMYPEEEVGQRFWDRVYQKSNDLYGTTDIPVNTFNKVWIVPEKAVVYQNGETVFVAESRLKVMLEEDYLALEHNSFQDESIGPNSDGVLKKESLAIVRDIIIPELEKEVNEGQNFASLRQIYHSMILATWFKRNLKRSMLAQVYFNQGKTEGIEIEDKLVKEKIYKQYLEAFEKGVYDYIKEDYDQTTQEVIPRKYFSGGIVGLDASVELVQTQDLVSVRSSSVVQRVKLIAEKTNMQSSKGNLSLVNGDDDGDGESFSEIELENFRDTVFNIIPLVKARDVLVNLGRAANDDQHKEKKGYEKKIEKQLLLLKRNGSNLFVREVVRRLVLEVDVVDKLGFFLQLASFKNSDNSFVFTAPRSLNKAFVRYDFREKEKMLGLIKDLQEIYKKGRPFEGRGNIAQFISDAGTLEEKAKLIKVLKKYKDSDGEAFSNKNIGNIVFLQGKTPVEKMELLAYSEQIVNKEGKRIIKRNNVARMFRDRENFNKEKFEKIQVVLKDVDLSSEELRSWMFSHNRYYGMLKSWMTEPFEKISSLERNFASDFVSSYASRLKEEHYIALADILLLPNEAKQFRSYFLNEKNNIIKMITDLQEIKENSDGFNYDPNIGKFVYGDGSLKEKLKFIANLKAFKDIEGEFLRDQDISNIIFYWGMKFGKKIEMFAYVTGVEDREGKSFLKRSHVVRMLTQKKSLDTDRLSKMLIILKNIEVSADELVVWFLEYDRYTNIFRSWMKDPFEGMDVKEKRFRSAFVSKYASRLEKQHFLDLGEVLFSSKEAKRFRDYFEGEEINIIRLIKEVQEIRGEFHNGSIGHFVYGDGTLEEKQTFVSNIKNYLDVDGESFNNNDLGWILFDIRTLAEKNEIFIGATKIEDESGNSRLKRSHISRMFWSQISFNKERFEQIQKVFQDIEISLDELVNWVFHADEYTDMLKSWKEEPFEGISVEERRFRSNFVSSYASRLEEHHIMALSEIFLLPGEVREFHDYFEGEEKNIVRLIKEAQAIKDRIGGGDVAAFVYGEGTFKEKYKLLNDIKKFRKLKRRSFQFKKIKSIVFGGKQNRIFQLNREVQELIEQGGVFRSEFSVNSFLFGAGTTEEKIELIKNLKEFKDSDGEHLTNKQIIKIVFSKDATSTEKNELLKNLKELKNKEGISIFKIKHLVSAFRNIKAFDKEEAYKLQEVLTDAGVSADEFLFWTLKSKQYANMLSSWIVKDPFEEISVKERRQWASFVSSFSPNLEKRHFIDLAAILLSSQEAEAFRQRLRGKDNNIVELIQKMQEIESKVGPDRYKSTIGFFVYGYGTLDQKAELIANLDNLKDAEGRPFRDNDRGDIIFGNGLAPNEKNDLFTYLIEVRNKDGVRLLKRSQISRVFLFSKYFNRDDFEKIQNILEDAGITNINETIAWTLNSGKYSEMLESWIDKPFAETTQEERRRRFVLTKRAYSILEEKHVVALARILLVPEKAEAFHLYVESEVEEDRKLLNRFLENQFTAEERDELLKRLAMSYNRDIRNKTVGHIKDIFSLGILEANRKFGDVGNDIIQDVLMRYDWSLPKAGLFRLRMNIGRRLKESSLYYSYWDEMPDEFKRILWKIRKFKYRKEKLTRQEIDNILIQRGHTIAEIAAARQYQQESFDRNFSKSKKTQYDVNADKSPMGRNPEEFFGQEPEELGFDDFDEGGFSGDEDENSVRWIPPPDDGSYRSYHSNLLKYFIEQEGWESESSSSIPGEAKEDVGGIDLNPNNLDLQTQGQNIDFNILQDSYHLESDQINGFSPVILQTIPITSLPMYLGMTDTNENQNDTRDYFNRDPMGSNPKKRFGV